MNKTPYETGKRKRYYGEWVAVVEDDRDPTGRMQVQVRVFGLFTPNVAKKDLPWATYRLPVGMRPNDGYFTPAKIGDYVWVDFPFNGDTRRPRITGSVHFTPGDVPNFPHEAWSGPEKLVYKRVDVEEDPGPTDYHRDAVATIHGYTLEVRRTGVLVFTHRKTGTSIQIDDDGIFTLHSENDIRITAQGGARVFVSGEMDVDAGGNVDIHGRTIHLNR